MCLLLYQHKCDRGLSAVMMMSRIVLFVPLLRRLSCVVAIRMLPFLPGTVCFVPAVQSLYLSLIYVFILCCADFNHLFANM